MEVPDTVVCEKDKGYELGSRSVFLKVGEANLGDHISNQRLDHHRNQLPNKLCVLGRHEQFVNKTIVPDMTRWILTGSLYSAELVVVSLAFNKYACLVDVGSEVRTNTEEELHHVGYLGSHVERTKEKEQDSCWYSYFEEVQEQAKVSE